MRLIDADKLKEDLYSNCDLCHDKNTNWCDHCCQLHDIEDLIDNAPTVEPFCPYLSDAEVKQPCIKAPCERPKGEWIFNTTHWSCSACNETVKTIGYCGTEDFMSANFKFCPNCGAEMKCNAGHI